MKKTLNNDVQQLYPYQQNQQLCPYQQNQQSPLTLNTQ